MAAILWGVSRRGSEGRGDLMGPPARGFAKAKRVPVATTVDPSVHDEVAALADRGEVIGAIKLVRDRTGLGLKEAKDYVDDLRQNEGTFR